MEGQEFDLYFNLEQPSDEIFEQNAPACQENAEFSSLDMAK